jgi:cation:H+ antiporter
VLVLYLLACVAGLVLLARSSDELVLGSSALAERIGVPTVAVGVVIIGFGTSAPELLVSGLASLAGSPAIGVGNIVGSNIANLTLVLGTAAVVAPLVVRAEVIRREVPVALAASVAFGVAVQSGLTRVEGLLLLAGLAVALTLLLRWSLAVRRTDGEGTPASDEDAEDDEDDELRKDVDSFLSETAGKTLRGVCGQALLGLVGTLAGAQALVWGAVGVARVASIDEGVIGVTIVAIGTSLPELVTAVQASRRGETDLIIGNLLGSNLFNALAVGGVVALAGPGPAGGPGLTCSGVLLMLSFSVLASVFMWRRLVVLRWEGAVLLAAYLASLPLIAGG